MEVVGRIFQYGNLIRRKFMIRYSDGRSEEFDINIPEIEERKNGHHVAYIPQHPNKLH